MKVRIAALAAIVVVLVGLGTLRAANRGQRAPADAPPAAAQEVSVPVEVTRVVPGELARTLTVTGTLRTDREVQISAKIPGRVAQVLAKEGDRVRAGQLLVLLDDVDQRAQVQQAEAGLRSAQERLAQSRAGESLRYTQTDAQIEQARANLQAARLRVQQLESAARITDASAKAAVARAESTLAAARDQLKIVQEGARAQELRVAENAVNQAKVNLDTARANVKRRRELHAEGAIAQEDLDEFEKQLQLAEAQYNSAVQQRDLLQEGARTEEVRIAEEQVRQADEALREARANLERTKMSHDDVAAARATVAQLTAALEVAQANKAQYQIVPRELAALEAAVSEARARVQLAREQLASVRVIAPVDGVVSTRTVNVGETIGAGSPLMTVVALHGVYFEAQVPERSMAAVRPGMSVRVTVDSLPGKTFRGVVREMIPVATPGSKNFRVRIGLADTEQLPVGAFARGEIDLGRYPRTLVVPKESLLSLAGENYVFAIDNGTVRRQPVKLGASDARHTQVLSGLKEGDRIVVGGVDTLSDGTRVQIVTGNNKQS
jgi:RND family efflux transporter MFP subunit